MASDRIEAATGLPHVSRASLSYLSVVLKSFKNTTDDDKKETSSRARKRCRIGEKRIPLETVKGVPAPHIYPVVLL